VYVAGRVTFDMLPDDVLLDIFDFYRMDSSYFPWIWHTLVHVCPRWRQIIFASPRRLDLQFLCTPRTRVKEMLKLLPPSVPIMISNSFDAPPPPRHSVSLGDGGQVIAAIEQRDRVWCIHLEDIPSSLLEKVATMMQETFPKLTYVRLWAGDGMAPILPDSFLGGSAPLLETFWLRGIPFPEVPKLLLSASDLIHLQLEKIPDSGYISPEAMITGLSTCTKLETLVIEFLSQYPHPDLASQQMASLTPASLPALTCFSFEGNGGYFDNFVPRIESPLLSLDDTIRHGINNSVNRHVLYEASLTLSGFSFRYYSR
jgi:hypothetical protein